MLTALQTNGFTINLQKCKWAFKETGWLGYWLTPDGHKPWNKKIDEVFLIDRPRNLKHIQSFLGVVK